MLTRQRGFTLLEMLLVLTLSSIVMMSTTSLFSQLIKHYLQTERHYRLQHIIGQLLSRLDKDLRRAGFIKLGRVNNAVAVQHSNNYQQVCLIIRYDLNHNGVIETLGDESELFGYRLYQGALEEHRGVNHCSGKGWQKLTDPGEVTLTQLLIEPLKNHTSRPYFKIQLKGHWSAQPEIQVDLTSIIGSENQ